VHPLHPLATPMIYAFCRSHRSLPTLITKASDRLGGLQVVLRGTGSKLRPHSASVQTLRAVDDDAAGSSSAAAVKIT